MFVEEDFLVRIESIVQDTEGIIQRPSYKTNLRRSVGAFQKIIPQEKTIKINGDGSTVEFNLDGWEPRFSQILKIQYPVTTSGEPCYLTGKDFQTIDTEDGQRLRIYSPFVSGQSARITYTLKHSVTGKESTIDDHDFDAVCNLAASFCCDYLSRYYSQTALSTIQADVVDYGEKGALYREQATQLKASFEDYVRSFEGSFGEWDTWASYGSWVFPRDVN